MADIGQFETYARVQANVVNSLVEDVSGGGILYEGDVATNISLYWRYSPEGNSGFTGHGWFTNVDSSPFTEYADDNAVNAYLESGDITTLVTEILNSWPGENRTAFFNDANVSLDTLRQDGCLSIRIG